MDLDSKYKELHPDTGAEVQVLKGDVTVADALKARPSSIASLRLDNISINIYYFLFVASLALRNARSGSLIFSSRPSPLPFSCVPVLARFLCKNYIYVVLYWSYK